ncbi:unannotated protein [freshwater metagenome]|uniref:Unannotated protein n=1 Tax=freshwater metagenome TaxID=449393 RepID=A0A6J6BJ22_9ZZZZ
MISSLDISTRSKPNVFAHPIWRLISAIRSLLDAILIEPHSRQVAGVSLFSNSLYNSTEYIFILVRVGSARSCPTRPAE